MDEVRPLNGKDFFSPGVVIRAQALTKPDEYTAEAPYPVVIEYLFPTEDPSVVGKFKVGDILEVKRVRTVRRSCTSAGRHGMMSSCCCSR